MARLFRWSAATALTAIIAAGILACGGDASEERSPLAAADIEAEHPATDEKAMAAGDAGGAVGEANSRADESIRDGAAAAAATPSESEAGDEHRLNASEAPPTELALPFDVTEVDADGGFFSPFGVVRWSLDRAEFGHSGIDIPLDEGADLYAVADGIILSVSASVDQRPGSIVTLLIDGRYPDGEGWGFLYEHVDLIEGLEIGSRVQRGDLIAVNPLRPLEANNHLQLTYLFEKYAFYRNHTCWVDQLASAGQRPLLDRFNAIRTGDGFVRAWETAEEESALPYTGLLDRSEFPEGPQLCYPLGTDVRVQG